MDRKTLVLPAAAGLPAPAVVVHGNDRVGGGNSETIVVGTTDRIGTTAETPTSLDSVACDSGRNAFRGTFRASPRLFRSGSIPPQGGPAFAGGHELTARTPRFTVRGGLTGRHTSFFDSYGSGSHDADHHGDRHDPATVRKFGTPLTRSRGSGTVRATAGDVSRGSHRAAAVGQPYGTHGSGRAVPPWQCGRASNSSSAFRPWVPGRGTRY